MTTPVPDWGADPRERAAYLALALTPGIGAARLSALLDACASPTGALVAPVAFLGSVLRHAGVAAAVRATSASSGEAVLAATGRLEGQVLLPWDAAFPPPLRAIPDPPMALFVAGDASLLARPAVAVVGSRDHTTYGADACRQVVDAAAAAGLVVVSGMARGLDAVAHARALERGAPTAGVLGNGLGVVYPAANRALYDRVRRFGVLVTEFPPGERPNAGSFPRRNRLISGLARVTVVVEAAKGSGALLTADAAAEQGREVMAVPGPITSSRSEGTNDLLRHGAAPWLEPDDLWDRYPLPERPVLGAAPAVPDLVPLPEGLDADALALVELLGGDEQPADVLAVRLGRPAASVLAGLTTLEVLGVVEARPGLRFRRRRA